MLEVSTADKIKLLELLEVIVSDLMNELEDPGFKEILPNKTKAVSLVAVCQFRRRESPDQIESLFIKEGEPVFLVDTGEVISSPAQKGDFPEVMNFNIPPGRS